MRILSLLVLALAASCASPLGGEDLELTGRLVAGPGVGASVSLAQNLRAGVPGRLDFEGTLVRQEVDEAVDEEGDVGDELTVVRIGLLWRPTPERAGTWTGRAGLAWLRSTGDAGALRNPGDYGGIYLGLGYEWKLGPHLATGPVWIAHWLDAEGDGNSGLVHMGGWGFTWRL